MASYISQIVNRRFLMATLAFELRIFGEGRAHASLGQLIAIRARRYSVLARFTLA